MFAFAETYIPILTTSTRTFIEGWDAAGNKTSLSTTSTETKSSGSNTSKPGVSSSGRSDSDAMSTMSPAAILTGVSTTSDAGTATSTTKKSDTVLEMHFDRASVAMDLACRMLFLL